MILPAKLVNERLMFLIDYGDKLPWGSVVTGAKIEVTVSSGEDTTPQKVFSQVWDIDGTIVTYQVRNGLPGVVYDLNTAVQVSGEWLYMTVKLAVLPDSGDVGALYPLTRVFTSLPYVQLMTDEISQSLEPTSGVLVKVLYESELQPDNVDISMTPNGGELIPPATGKFLDDVTLSAAIPTDGDLFIPPPAIVDPDACVADIALEPSTGILAVPPLGELQIDETDLALIPTGGTLSNPSGDPYWANVISLLHFDGSFTDQAGITWTPYGGAATSTVKSKFGSASLPPGNQIVGSSAPIWEFYKAAFTIEFWLDRAASGDSGLIVDQWQYNLRFRLTVESGIVYFRFYEVGVILRTVSFPISFVAGFRHYAICRDSGGVFHGFDHGTPATVTNPGPYTGGVYSHSGEAVVVGGVNGYLDDLRITSGVARYSSAFTPPTAAFPDS